MNDQKNVAKKEKVTKLTPEQQAAKDQADAQQKVERERKKVENFLRIANMRVPKALNMLRIVGNLTNRNNYSYTPEQSKKIIDALQKEVDAIRDAFSSTERRAGEFSL